MSEDQKNVGTNPTEGEAAGAATENTEAKKSLFERAIDDVMRRILRPLNKNQPAILWELIQFCHKSDGCDSEDFFGRRTLATLGVFGLIDSDGDITLLVEQAILKTTKMGDGDEPNEITLLPGYWDDDGSEDDDQEGPSEYIAKFLSGIFGGEGIPLSSAGIFGPFSCGGGCGHEECPDD